MNVKIQAERLTKDQYITFLKKTDLGSQYPRERFEERIEKLVKNASISLTARDEAGLLAGVLFGITDFAYWLFITDLGVDRRYVGKGIGRQLMQTAHELAGGEGDIILYTCANENAIGFYEKFGMERALDVMVKNHVEWTDFTVE
ncbi:MAG: GNAT family N-acetyltransferase [Clostridia bacterium]|nr:GNAT family N-acetyltransferase [Clostridia bacterium]